MRTAKLKDTDWRLILQLVGVNGNVARTLLDRGEFGNGKFTEDALVARQIRSEALVRSIKRQTELST